MKYQTLDQARQLATVRPLGTPALTSYGERLERWADQLDACMVGKLELLQGTEFASNARRSAMRGEGSPLSIAFADPLLRAQGLSDDTYGEARRFFGIRHETLHGIVCYCRYAGSAASPTEIGARVRQAARRARRIERMMAAIGLHGTRAGLFLSRLFV